VLVLELDNLDFLPIFRLIRSPEVRNRPRSKGCRDRRHEPWRKPLAALTDAFHMDTSGIIKKALWELYEDVQDAAVNEAFAVREDAGDTGFAPIDVLMDESGS
jgi:hypothetical protein